MIGRIEKRGRTSWRLRFDSGPDPITGERRQQNITFRGTKRAAEQRLAELVTAVGKSSYVEPKKINVRDFLGERLDHWVKVGDITPGTSERYQELIEHQINRFLGDRLIQRLGTVDIERWHALLRTEGHAGGGALKTSTIRAAHGILRKALGEALRHGLVVRNVCARDSGQRAPKADSSEVEIIDRDRIGEVIDKLRGRAIFPKAVLALLCGLRRSEILALRWRDVDLPAKTLRVRQAIEETRLHGLRIKETKTRNGRRDLIMPDLVVETLTEARREALELRMAMGLGRLTEDTPVFPRPFDGSYQSPNVLSGDWREAVLVLGLPSVNFHSLRHSHVAMLIDSGIDILRVSRRLGHSDASTTLKIYGHLFARRDDRSATAVNATLAGLGTTRCD